MKKIAFIALAILAASTLFSCQKEAAPATSSQKIKFNITVANLNSATKAVKTDWYVGDKVNIWFDENTQKTPDLVMTYDGTAWIAGSLRSGFTPAAEGTMKVVFEGYNDLNQYNFTPTANAWYTVKQGSIGSITRDVYKPNLLAFSYPDSYTYSDGTVTAHIAKWMVFSDFQVVVTGLPEGTYAMQTTNPLRVAVGFIVEPTKISHGGREAYYYALGQPNGENDLAFYFLKDADIQNMSHRFKVTLIDANGNRYEYLKNEMDYTDPGSYQGVKLSFAKFKTVNNKINGHEFVDLGNGLKWATINVGATSEVGVGDYYAWGETEPYYTTLSPLVWKDGKDTGYSWAAYTKFTSDNGETFSKYNSTDNLTQLESGDDVASEIWGGTWRIPTYEEWKWLRTNCYWTWTSTLGIPGFLVRSKIDGYTERSIFLPCSGEYNNTTFYPDRGHYWTATSALIKYGWYLYLYHDNSSYQNTIDFSYKSRCYGLTVRPVSD